MVYAVEAWTIPEGEEPCEEWMIDSTEFEDKQEAMEWVWERLEEGYAIRMYRR